MVIFVFEKSAVIMDPREFEKLSLKILFYISNWDPDSTNINPSSKGLFFSNNIFETYKLVINFAFVGSY